MNYTGENLVKLNLWRQIISWAKIVVELAGHDIPIVPVDTEYKIKHETYEDLMF